MTSAHRGHRHKPRQEASLPDNAPPAFHLLVKPSGAACNLACAYCFYLDKSALYPGSSLRMSDEVLKAYIRQLLASHQAPVMDVSWQGGEPTLMGLDFFERSVELVKRYKRSGQRICYSIQTNGTRLDDDWCAFFKRHDFLVGLSIDGPPELHNAYRVDKGGRGSFDLVRRAWRLLQQHEVDTNILCAVHAANASHPLEVYRFFRDELQAKFIQFIPIVERIRNTSLTQSNEVNAASAGSLVSSRSVNPEQYGLFLIDIFDEWMRGDVGKVFVQIFDAALASWCELPANVCVFQEVCGLSLVLEHNGDLYSCDHFVEPGYLLGNILKTPLIELVCSDRQREFGLAKRERLPSCCLSCDVFFACRGECPRNRFVSLSEGDAPAQEEYPLNYLCAGYKLFFRHIAHPMQVMASRLRLFF